MKLLFIVHATSWSDKEIMAKEGIKNVLTNEKFDNIIEVIQSREDIYEKRYLTHNGIIYKHPDISPVNFFKDKLFNNLFPLVDEVTIVGGTFNTTGGGCFNVAFDFLINYYVKNKKTTKINIIPNCIYNSDHQIFSDELIFEQCLKDLIWKLNKSNISFSFIYNDIKIINKDALIKIKVE